MLNRLVQMCPGPFPVCHSSSLSPNFPALFLLSYQNKSFELKNQNSTAKKTKTKKLCCDQLTVTEHNISVSALVHIGSRL